MKGTAWIWRRCPCIFLLRALQIRTSQSVEIFVRNQSEGQGNARLWFMDILEIFCQAWEFYRWKIIVNDCTVLQIHNVPGLRYRSMVSVPAQKTRHSESTFGHFHSDLFGTLPPPPIHSRSSSDMTPLSSSLRGTFDRFTALFRLLLQWLEVYFATGTWTRSRRRRARSTATPTAAGGGSHCDLERY